jgi:hypothetical protein
VARRNHSLRGELALTKHPDEVLPPLSKDHRSELERRFEKLRKDPESSDSLEGLVDTITAIFTADEREALPTPSASTRSSAHSPDTRPRPT